MYIFYIFKAIYIGYYDFWKILFIDYYEKRRTMAIRIISDSGCDITKAEIEKLDIKVLPLKVRFDETEYLDGVELDHKTFYEKLIESDELPKTSQITPFEFEELFEEYTNNKDEVICFTISSALSGCYQSACVAASDYDNVYVIDTLNVSIASRLLIELAVKYRDEGMSCKDIVNKIEEIKPRLRVLALMDTLEYLKKGGRISAAAALAGGLLSIKPVVTVEEGKVVVVGKARGSKNGNNVLRTLVDQCGGIDFDMPHATAYTGLSDTLMKKYIEDSKAMYENDIDDVRIFTIGSAIGTHLGPGTIAVAFIARR